MTALIGALNKHGVAIAADSAATIGNGHYDKVYNTANKIFTLSKMHPIGIMICGNAEFLGVPWDIVIKSYRKSLGAKSFDYVTDYVTDFFQYLRSDILPFSEFKIPAKVISNVVGNILNSLVNKILPKPVGGKIQLPPPQSLCNAISNEIAAVGYDNNCDEMFKDARKVLGPLCAPLATQLCGVTPGDYNVQGIQGVIQMLLEQFVFALLLRQNSSQLVFVGYGEKEFFPNITSVWVYTSFDSQWKEVRADSQSITHKQNALICPFAQMEDMATLIEGIHPALEKALQSVVGNTLNSYKQEILKHVSDPVTKEAINKVDVGKYVSMYRQSCAVQKGQAYSRPIVSHIAQLEKEDLALLAENLIAITSLRKKVTMAPESVGGPIDVAVISKYDGFIWMKRKLYFDKTLNPHFHDNYYREVQPTASNTNQSSSETTQDQENQD